MDARWSRVIWSGPEVGVGITTMAAVPDFGRRRRRSLRHALTGVEVTVQREEPSFARLAVADLTAGNTSMVEWGVDWRAYRPVLLAIGPVLHPADTVANMQCALFGAGRST